MDHDLHKFERFQGDLAMLCLPSDKYANEYPRRVAGILFEGDKSQRRNIVKYFINKYPTRSRMIDLVRFIREYRRDIFPSCKYREDSNKFIAVNGYKRNTSIAYYLLNELCEN